MSSPRTPRRNVISEVLDNLKPFSTPKRVLFQDSLQISSLREEKKDVVPLQLEADDAIEKSQQTPLHENDSHSPISSEGKSCSDEQDVVGNEDVSMDSHHLDFENTVSSEPAESNFDDVSENIIPKADSLQQYISPELGMETEIASTDSVTFEYVNFQTCLEGIEENMLTEPLIKTSGLISRVQDGSDLREEEVEGKENESQSQFSDISREIGGFNSCVEFFEPSLFEECELSEMGYTSCVENGSLKQYLMSPLRRSSRIREKVESEKKESTVRRMYSSPAIKTCVSTRTRGDTDSDLESRAHVSTLKRSRRRLIFTDLSGGSEEGEEEENDTDSVKSARIRRSSRLMTPNSTRC